MKTKKKSAFKVKVWSMVKADNEFSKWIRARDGKCLRCGTTEHLTCSHYWGRRCKDLRYEPDNCITLCWFRCHKYGWEKEKHGAYRDFMIQRLGQERFDELRSIYYTPQIKQRESIERCMKFLGAMKIIEENKLA